MPLVQGVSERAVKVCPMAENRWSNGTCFEELEPLSEEISAQESEKEIREGGRAVESEHVRAGVGRVFKWSPKFKDVQDGIEKTEPDNDGWAVASELTW